VEPQRGRHLGAGGDDLRGNSWQGDDNLNVTIVSLNRPPLTIPDVNNGQNWPNGSTNVVQICLDGTGLNPGDISGIRLATTTADGVFADNWDLGSLSARYLSWSTQRSEWTTQSLYDAGGTPLYRFTASNPVRNVPVNGIFDGGFEAQAGRSAASPWVTEGPDAKGIDIGLGQQFDGRNNGFTWSTGGNWNALLQTVPVAPNTWYVLSGWVRTSSNISIGYFGARQSGIWPPPGEVHFGNTNGRYQNVVSTFNSGDHTAVTVYCGLWGTGTPAGDWVQIDDITLTKMPR